MKTILHTLALSLVLACAPTAFGQAKKPATPVVPTKPAEKAPEAPAKAPTKARALPFNTTVDELDAAGKSFTHANKDGKKVKNVVTETTEFKGEAAGKKFEDIKAGDTVNGSRVKANDAGTEYTVSAVTFIGVAPAKPAPKK